MNFVSDTLSLTLQRYFFYQYINFILHYISTKSAINPIELHFLIKVLRCKQNLRAGVCRPCDETKLTATEKSVTDGH